MGVLSGCRMLAKPPVSFGVEGSRMAALEEGARAETKRSGLPRNVWIVTLTSFFTDLANEMLIQLMPLYLTGVLGAQPSVVGLIEGVAETTASLLKVFAGWLSDRLGQRKWLTVLGYGFSTISRPFLYFANSWIAVLAVRFSDRVGKGIRTAPRDALVADATPEHERGRAFGFNRAGDRLGGFLGLGLAAAIIYLMQPGQADLMRRTFQMAVLVGIIPGVTAVLVLALGAKDVPIKGLRERPSLSLKGFDRRFKIFMAIVVLFTLGNSADAFIVVRARERGLSVLGIMAMAMTYYLVSSLSSGPAGRLSDRIGRRWLMLGGWLTYGLIYLGFALAGPAWQVWALYGLYGLYYGMTEGVARALVADIVPAAQRGTAYGVYNAAVGLAALPASLIAGILWSGVFGWSGLGPAAPFFFGAGMAFLASVLLITWLPRAVQVPRTA